MAAANPNVTVFRASVADSPGRTSGLSDSPPANFDSGSPFVPGDFALSTSAQIAGVRPHMVATLSVQTLIDRYIELGELGAVTPAIPKAHGEPI